MKPLKERLDEAADVYQNKESSYGWNPSDVYIAYLAGANWMQAEMQKEIDGLVDVVKIAYLKHNCGDDSIGWDELSTILHSSLCNAIGDDAYCEWIDNYKKSRGDS